MIDIACVYSFITDKSMQAAFNYGYYTSGGNIDPYMLDICTAFNELLGLLLHIDKLVTESWFDNWFNKLCCSYFMPVINKKEPVWTKLNV